MSVHEQGEPTLWDNAWREGYTSALAAVLGVPRREAHRLAKDLWRPGKNWRTRLGRWLLKPSPHDPPDPALTGPEEPL